MVQVADVLGWLDDYAPFRYAESWDRCGLLVGEPRAGVERVLVALDPTSATIEEAAAGNCECLVTHHPLFLRPLDDLRTDRFPGRLIAMALRNGIHLIAAHTNLDAARQGTNDQLAGLLGLEAVEPLASDATYSGEARYGGMGRIGRLRQPIAFTGLVDSVQTAMGGLAVRMVGDPERKVYRVALCSGSGASLLDQVIAAGSDVYITGDVKYHEAQRAVEAGLALLDIGHFASERLILAPLAEYLRTRAVSDGSPLEIRVASQEKDPFCFRDEQC